MIHIVFTILKIIGILLLIVLGLLLFLVISVLFVPIRYKGKINIDDEHKDFELKIGYFLKLVRFNFALHDKETDYSLKILFKNLIKKQENQDVSEENASVKKTAEGKEKIDKIVGKENNSGAKTESETVLNKDDNSSDKSNTIAEETPEAKKALETEEAPEVEEISEAEEIPETEKIPEADNISRKKTKGSVIDFFKNIKFKIRKFCDKLSRINEKKQEYLNFLGTKESKETIKQLKHIFFETLKYVSPYKIKGRIRFGLDSPDSTGKLLGIISIFYFKALKKLKLEPDFENNVFQGNIQFKGRIRGIYLLITGIKIFKLKRLKEFIKFVKN